MRYELSGVQAFEGPSFVAMVWDHLEQRTLKVEGRTVEQIQEGLLAYGLTWDGTAL